MRQTQIYGLLLAAGAVAFVVQVVSLVRALRLWRAKPDGHRRALWPNAAMASLSLAMPIAVLALVSHGRRQFIAMSLSTQRPSWEALTRPASQVELLYLGATLAAPSLLLGAMALALAAGAMSRDKLLRALSWSVVPVTLAPFLGGGWLFLHRLRKMLDAPPFTALDASASTPLAWGALAAAFGLGLVVALGAHALRRMPRAAETPHHAVRGTILVSVLMVIAAGGLVWRAAPLAAENSLPWPATTQDFPVRVMPPIAAGLSQAELYDLSTRRLLGGHRHPLPFPLTTRPQEPISAPSVSIELARDREAVSWAQAKDVAQMVDLLNLDISNFDLLHPGVAMDTLLLHARPDVPTTMVRDALHAALDTGFREIRLVTGLVDTIHRPTLGPISRAQWQATRVRIVRSGAPVPSVGVPPLLVPGKYPEYRDLLDAIFSAQQPGQPATLVVQDSESVSDQR
jgi:hypothetical protein